MAKNEAIRIKVSTLETICNVMGDHAYSFIGKSLISISKHHNSCPFKKDSYKWGMYMVLKQGIETESTEGIIYKAPKPIDKYDLEGNLIAQYSTTREMLAAENLEYGEETKQIWLCANGVIDSALGFVWKWHTDE